MAMTPKKKSSKIKQPETVSDEVGNPHGKVDVWKLMEDVYFKEKYVLYQYQYNSYNQFIEECVLSELVNSQNIIHIRTDAKTNKLYKYRFKFENVILKPPSDENGNEDEIMFPSEARLKQSSYSSRLIADVKQIQEVVDITTGEVESEKVLFEDRIPVARIPIMVRSRYCSTTLRPDIDDRECPFDPGCYFIIKGGERIILSVERQCDNKMIIFTQKDSNFPDGIVYTLRVNSRPADNFMAKSQIVSIKRRKDNSIVFSMLHFAEIPVFVFMKALGLESDHDIIRYIVYDENDISMINTLKASLIASKTENYKDDDNVVHYVRTQEDAMNYLLSKLKARASYLETDADTRNAQKREQLTRILENDLLPHMGKGLYEKGLYIGLMCNKLIKCILGRIEPDDRDSYSNKRIELPGVLLGQRFREYFKKMIMDCAKKFKNKMGGLSDDGNPINVINQIKTNTIELGLYSGLTTGTWDKRTGVAQLLQRMTYPQMISSDRRIMVIIDTTNNKVEQMRHVNSIQYGFVDPIETPEGSKVGLSKHLSLTANISINLKHQPEIIRNLLEDSPVQVKRLTDVPPIDLKRMTKVFLNGEWLGMTDEPSQMVAYLREKRQLGFIDKMVGIVHIFNTKEIRINTDGGRLYRPLLKVKDNQLLLSHAIINELDKKSTKPKNWNEFLMKHPEVIEYVDIEEAEHLMICMTQEELQRERRLMLTPVEDPSPNGNVVNRYKNVYRRFTHCEIHPCMMMGTISSNIPFAEHNQSPRNYFNFAQARHAMGINASTYRHRMDLTYLLYQPQIPLVHTKAAKFTGMLNLPTGENIVVAIATYTGYNQEDSLIFNQSAIDRGLFRATSFKKEHDVIQKNPATGQDEVFMKPDVNRVSGIKHGNYNKLNDKGYVPEETVIEENDVLIGKVTPIQPSASNNMKIYKDSSSVYRSGVPGVVDKVYTGIYNADGYEMYTMRIRNERVPRVGDKFCVDPRSEVLTNKGWIKFDEMYHRYKLGEEFTVATLHDGKFIKYDKPIDVYEFDYDGYMYKLTSQQVDFCITMDHEMWARKRDKNYFELVKAADLYGKRYNLKKDGWIDKPDVETIDINGKVFKMDDFLKFLGVYLISGRKGDGHEFYTGKYINMWSTNIILNFLSENNIPYEDDDEGTINIFCMELFNSHILGITGNDTSIPEFVFHLNTNQVRVFLESMIRKSGLDVNHKKANEIMHLAIHAGWSATIKRLCDLNGEEKYKIIINKEDNEPVIDNRDGAEEELIKYKGKVYCLEVPSHVFMFRYNNKNVWSGNCSRAGSFKRRRA
jgi:DNA-directed RNA polymerase II subunit RPB2